MIADPKPSAIAKAIDEIAEDRNQAIRFGERGKKKLKEMNITWDHVVKELTKP